MENRNACQSQLENKAESDRSDREDESEGQDREVSKDESFPALPEEECESIEIEEITVEDSDFHANDFIFKVPEIPKAEKLL